MATMLEAVRHVVVVTGAGFSAPSGLPVYRNAEAGKVSGGWFDNKTARLMHADEYAEHLNEIWPRWHQLAHLARTSEPNAAHLALARWERLLKSRDEPGSLTVVTQNIDGLHQRAGNTTVLEAHGTILKARRIGGHSLFQFTPSTDFNTGPPPEAPDGSTRTRPDIVLFGEQPRHMEEAVDAVQRADLVIFAGTSGQVWPVAGLLDVANLSRPQTMLLNRNPWTHGRFDVVVLDDVLALDQIVPHDPATTEPRRSHHD